MFPFYQPQPSNSIKDMIEGLKALEEWQKANKPKDEKKKDPDAWGPLDYFMMYMTLQLGCAVVLAVTILSYIETIVKH